MIKFPYPKLMVEKAHRLAKWADANARTQRQRDRLCQDAYGLTQRYLRRVGTVHRTPSNRTLMNLGFELVVRDKTTGEEEIVNLREDAPCDWSR